MEEENLCQVGAGSFSLTCYTVCMIEQHIFMITPGTTPFKIEVFSNGSRKRIGLEGPAAVAPLILAPRATGDVLSFWQIRLTSEMTSNASDLLFSWIIFGFVTEHGEVTTSRYCCLLVVPC